MHRTKKLPATAKTNEGPSISRVSAYSMGNTALGRQGGVGGASGERGQVSGLAKFLGEAKKQHGDGGVVGGSSKTPAPADLDRVNNEDSPTAAHRGCRSDAAITLAPGTAAVQATAASFVRMIVVALQFPSLLTARVSTPFICCAYQAFDEFLKEVGAS